MPLFGRKNKNKKENGNDMTTTLTSNDGNSNKQKQSTDNQNSQNNQNNVGHNHHQTANVANFLSQDPDFYRQVSYSNSGPTDELEVEVEEILRLHSLDGKTAGGPSAIALPVNTNDNINNNNDKDDAKSNNNYNNNPGGLKKGRTGELSAGYQFSPTIGPTSSSFIGDNLNDIDEVDNNLNSFGFSDHIVAKINNQTDINQDKTKSPLVSPLSAPRRSNKLSKKEQVQILKQVQEKEIEHKQEQQQQQQVYVQSQQSQQSQQVKQYKQVDDEKQLNNNNQKNQKHKPVAFSMNKIRPLGSGDVKYDINKLDRQFIRDCRVLLAGNSLSGRTTLLTRFRIMNNVNPFGHWKSNIEYQSVIIWNLVECMDCLIECSNELRERYCLEINELTMSENEIFQIKKYDRLKDGLSKMNRRSVEFLHMDFTGWDSWRNMIQKHWGRDTSQFNEKKLKECNGMLKTLEKDFNNLLNDKVIKFTLTQLYTCNSFDKHQIIYWFVDPRQNWKRVFSSIQWIPIEPDYVYTRYPLEDLENTRFMRWTSFQFEHYAKFVFFDIDNNFQKNIWWMERGSIQVQNFVFILSLSSYAEKSIKIEGIGDNRFNESLQLFETWMNLPIIHKQIETVTLILTFCDEFKNLLNAIPFNTRIKDYKGKNDPPSILKYVITKFEKIYIEKFVLPKIYEIAQNKVNGGNKDENKIIPSKKIKYHLVSGWNANSVGRIWDSLKKSLFPIAPLVECNWDGPLD